MSAFTLIETLVSMTLISIIFLMIVQAFNSLLLGSYLIDARTSVSNEGEFVGEYFKLRVKNADPRSVKCSGPSDSIKSVTWQPKGASDTFTFFADQVQPGKYRFCLGQSTTPTCDTVLTYNDVNVTNVSFNCEAPSFDQAQVANVNLNFSLDSTAQLGNQPAVKGVSRFINVSIR